MAKIDDLLAERARVAASIPKLPASGAMTIDSDGYLHVNYGCKFSRDKALEYAAFIREWYSDPTPPPPDAATLRKAEMFEELVSEMTAANDELCGAVGSAVFGSGTILDAYQAFYARFAKSLAKAKAAKA